MEGCHVVQNFYQPAGPAPEAKSEPQQEGEAAPAETEETETVEEEKAQELDFKELPMEERIRLAIERMREEKVFKHQYDYAWILVAMEEMEEMPRFYSLREFYAYMKETIGIGGLPSLRSVQKGYSERFGGSGLEKDRRERVKNRFIAAFRKGI